MSDSIISGLASEIALSYPVTIEEAERLVVRVDIMQEQLGLMSYEQKKRLVESLASMAEHNGVTCDRAAMIFHAVVKRYGPTATAPPEPPES